MESTITTKRHSKINKIPVEVKRNLNFPKCKIDTITLLYWDQETRKKIFTNKKVLEIIRFMNEGFKNMFH